MGPEDDFQEAYASKIPLDTIWNRFDIDFKMILERLRALSQRWKPEVTNKQIL